MNKQTESFKANYERLKSIAEELQKQEEPDIDQLVPKVEEALKAYKLCKERIETVRKKLEETLGEQIESIAEKPLEPDSEQSEPGRNMRSFKKESSFDRELDDEIPF